MPVSWGLTGYDRNWTVVTGCDRHKDVATLHLPLDFFSPVLLHSHRTFMCLALYPIKIS